MFEWMREPMREARLAGLLPTALPLLAGGVVQHLARVGKRGFRHITREHACNFERLSSPDTTESEVSGTSPWVLRTT